MEMMLHQLSYSKDPSTEGFDLSTGERWIYPANYPRREYQFNIVNSALYHNTLVCLPTGLGKTFIAAVIMYNFWRWYPTGKIVFLAPTKPLVAQQVEACQKIMGISRDESIELTGAMDQQKRQVAWTKHRVIFATPQTFHNDLEKNIVPSQLVKCVVVDEAHRALGNHAYCESIRLLSERNQYFRILGLSATPGGKIDAVQKVVKNLHIAQLELRDDTSPDIIPYINERKLDIDVVGLGVDLENFKDRYITIMDPHVRVLIDNNVLRGNTGNISKGRIFMVMKDYSQKAQKGHNHGLIMKSLNILMTMYHGYDLMVRNGLRAFYNFYQDHKDKFWLKDEPKLMELLEEIIYYVGPFPDVRPLPDGSVPEIPENIRFGHEKFHRLKDILLRHFEKFKDKQENTRVIVFVEYRAIVDEIYVLLLQSRPLLRPQKFVGQAGQKQRQQKIALEDFRSNKVNVLISTSVGEEGLDVGEVDLIVCFDVSQASPIRLVQRMGRTGRKRDGHIIVLVTAGKEHQTLKAAMSRRDSLNNKVLQSSGILEALHEESPRMIPPQFSPECVERTLSVPVSATTTKGKGKAKEPKKTRKRADTTKKTKVSKNPEPSTSKDKPASQSSLMKFLKRTRDEADLDVDNDIVSSPVKEPRLWISQRSQPDLKNNNTIKLSNVKLLSSDDAAVEFLTLCTMKRSQNEQEETDKSRENSHFSSYYATNQKREGFFDAFVIPDLRTLDCLTNITEYVPPPCNIDEDEHKIFEDDDCDPPNFSQPALQDSRFEALLDESTSDSDVAMPDPQEELKLDFPATEDVDWGANENRTKFEDLLDECSDESIICCDEEDSKNNPTSLEIPGKFEDIMDSSSAESDKTQYSPQKQTTGESPVAATGSKFEDIMDASSDDSDKTQYSPQKQTANPYAGTSSKFEDMMNCSSDDSDKTHYSPQRQTPNPYAGTSSKFEDIMNCSSNDSDKTHYSPRKQTATPDAGTISKFEDMLNSSSGDSDKTHYSPQKQPDAPSVKMSNAEDPIEISSDTGSPTSWQASRPRKPLEIILNDGSIDLLNECEYNEKPLLSADESKRRHFKIISDIHELSTSGVQKKSALTDLQREARSQSFGNSETEKPLVNREQTDSLSTEQESRKKSQSSGINLQKVPENVSQRNSLPNIPQPEETSQFLGNKRDYRPSNSVSGVEEISTLNVNLKNRNAASREKSPCSASEPDDDYNESSLVSRKATTGAQDNSTQSVPSMLTLSQTLQEIQRINSSLFTSDGSRKSNAKVDQSCSKLLDRSETVTREKDKQTESDEDIFGNDDFMVDSDFEEQIDKIERTDGAEVNKSGGQASLDASVQAADIDTYCRTLVVESNPKKIDDDSIALPAKPTVSVFDFDSFGWDGDDNFIDANPAPAASRGLERNVLNNYEDSGSRNDRNISAFENSADKVNVGQLDWDSDIIENRDSPPVVPSCSRQNPEEAYWRRRLSRDSTPPVAQIAKNTNRSSVYEKKFCNIDSNDRANDSPRSCTNSSIPDFIDDWDLDTEDLETTPAALNNCSPSCAKSRNVPGSSGSGGSSLNINAKNSRPSVKLKQVEETTGWLSTNKPKLRLTLGKKLSRNFRKNLSTEQTSKKTSPVGGDSDSENEFAVSKIVTNAVRESESDYFAKPADPVDKASRLGSLGMFNPRRAARRPLSLRRNDADNIGLAALKDFSAPAKYTKQQQRDAENNRRIGAGKQKFASVDLDTREKKKRRRNDRQRPRTRSEFVDDEAEVSSDDDHTSGSSGVDEDLEGFVSYTQQADDPVDMHAHYLQTVRSPRRAGGFHIRKPRSPSPNMQIYSQALPNEPNTYLHDSFCVADDEVFEDAETPGDLTMLEEYAKRRVNKKRKRGFSKGSQAKRKRTVLAPASDMSSSEDETEKLRRQIQDESIILRSKRE